MCEWGVEDPWTWGDAVAQSWRMAGDHTGNWDSTKSVIRSSAAIAAANTGVPYGWNDMDMLETGCGLQCAHANGRQPNMVGSPASRTSCTSFITAQQQPTHPLALHKPPSPTTCPAPPPPPPHPD